VARITLRTEDAPLKLGGAPAVGRIARGRDRGNVGEQRAAALQDAPDRILLVRGKVAVVQALAHHAGKRQMRSVRRRISLKRSLYSRARRTPRSGSSETHSRKRSLICCCFSRAAMVSCWLTTRLPSSRSLTEGYIMDPEASGSAIVIHHRTQNTSACHLRISSASSANSTRPRRKPPPADLTLSFRKGT